MTLLITLNGVTLIITLLITQNGVTLIIALLITQNGVTLIIALLYNQLTKSPAPSSRTPGAPKPGPSDSSY